MSTLYPTRYLAELTDEARKLACELKTKKVRTPTERQLLADQCYELLVEFSCLATPMGPGEDPRQLPEGVSLVDRFGPWADRQCSAIRFATLLTADQYTPRAKRDWYARPQRDFRTASESDSGFRAELRVMDEQVAALRSRRRTST
jgi:hypothetical protein